MDGSTLFKAVVTRTLLATALVAGTVSAQSALSSDHIVITVPNNYDCSRESRQCWQTNPPHAQRAINHCTWKYGMVVTTHPADATCDKHTSR